MKNRSNVRKKETEKGSRRKRRIFQVLLFIGLFAGSAWAAYAGFRYLRPLDLSFAERVARIENVEVEGNRQLSREDVLTQLDMEAMNLLSIDIDALRKRLVDHRWIVDAGVRKEFPSTLRIRITEREPVALLERKGKFLLLDSTGHVIETLRSNRIPFLPVLKGVREDPVCSEAMELVQVLERKGLLSRSESIEIHAENPESLVMNLDGIVVKVGNGDFEEKLDRWFSIEPEVAKRRIYVDHVDLRYADRVIVTPLNGASDHG